MIYFLGNCQADFVSKELANKGYDTTYRMLASPLTYPSHPGEIPASLAELAEKYDLSKYFLGRELINQFKPVTADDKPELIVLSLFHENTPLFIYNGGEYIFYMDTTALTAHPEVMEWAQNNCQMFQPDRNTYLDRYRDMLVRLRTEVPDVPIVILSRLSHFPAFGPEPYSYLEGWVKLYKTSGDILRAWADKLDNVHIMEMDRVFGGIWQESEAGIETHCPFLKIELQRDKEDHVIGLHASRDIEHIGPMPARLADKLIHFMKTGGVEYGESEIVLPEWQRYWRSTKLSDEAMLAKLTSGANYMCAEAIASFFVDTLKDYTHLLVQAKDTMPVCHMTLHMVKAYSTLWRNPALIPWCETHRKLAEQFTDNGPIYQDVYLRRIDAIQAALE